MSRSNPSAHLSNPAVRWFEWSGETGVVRYYDKDTKANITVPLPFTFILLDELASVRGWHDASQSGIYSNDVKDVAQDVMVVKAFKGGILAEGRYKEIKDRVNACGGRYTSNLYIAFKHGGELAIGGLRFKGAALGTWMEFRKAHQSGIYQDAVTIHATTSGKKGRIVFQMPAFKLIDLSPETARVALALDLELQSYLKPYLSRTKHDQVAQPPAEPDSYESEPLPSEPEIETRPTDDELDAIPFAWLLPLVLPAIGLLSGGVA